MLSGRWEKLSIAILCLLTRVAFLFPGFHMNYGLRVWDSLYWRWSDYWVCSHFYTCVQRHGTALPDLQFPIHVSTYGCVLLVWRQDLHRASSPTVASYLPLLWHPRRLSLLPSAPFHGGNRAHSLPHLDSQTLKDFFQLVLPLPTSPTTVFPRSELGCGVFSCLLLHSMSNFPSSERSGRRVCLATVFLNPLAFGWELL
jgi:hypothetical protein